MALRRTDIDQALLYAEQLKLTAELDPIDGKTLIFKRLPTIPAHFPAEVVLVLEICIEYHQRCVFTGEYLQADDDPPGFKAANALEEINFYLEHYKPHFLKEVKKGLESDEIAPEEPPKIPLTPYAEIMLKHRQRQKPKT